MNNMEQIIVTGMGVLSTAGFTLNDFWNVLHQGKDTYKQLDFCMNNSQYRIKIGCRKIFRKSMEIQLVTRLLLRYKR